MNKTKPIFTTLKMESGKFKNLSGAGRAFTLVLAIRNELLCGYLRETHAAFSMNQSQIVL
jgi:hypothetical protein